MIASFGSKPGPTLSPHGSTIPIPRISNQTNFNLHPFSWKPMMPAANEREQRCHDTLPLAYGNVIETQEHKGQFKEW
jgi:hypothetical protein